MKRPAEFARMAEMSNYELVALAKAKFGKTGWLAKLASETGVHIRTVERWVKGEVRITDRVASHVRAVCK